MRAILIDWLVQVSLKFRLLQETMYMTVGIIDRFLQVSSIAPRCRLLGDGACKPLPVVFNRTTQSPRSSCSSSA